MSDGKIRHSSALKFFSRLRVRMKTQKNRSLINWLIIYFDGEVHCFDQVLESYPQQFVLQFFLHKKYNSKKKGAFDKFDSVRGIICKKNLKSLNII